MGEHEIRYMYTLIIFCRYNVYLATLAFCQTLERSSENLKQVEQTLLVLAEDFQRN